MNVTLSPVDLALIALYFIAVLAIGFLTKRKPSDAAEFLLAGRSLTLPLFVMTLVSTWYGGILGVGEFSYLYGISNWVVQGIPYYVFALLFALFLAKKIRATNLTTIPDQLERAYDRRTAMLGGALTFILTTPAPYILMLGMLMHLVTGWGILLCIFIGTAVSTVYLFFGGFRADVNTDVLEFVLMFLGFSVIIPFAYQKFGGMEFITANIPALHLTWNGGNSMQFVLVWFLIALWTLIDPAFHQRCSAAKSGEVAQKGILVSILFWFLFDAMTATAGLYARAALPALEQPMMAFPLLAEVTLPPVAKGLFYIGMLATIMSTLNTLTFVSATSLGRDILWRSHRDRDGINDAQYIRWSMLATALFSILLCVFVPSVIRQWYVIGTVVVPGLLLPVLASYFERWKVAAGYCFAAMLLGWLTSTVWLLSGWTQAAGSSHQYPLGIEPMFPGLLVSALVWGMGMIANGRES
ncbi:MAG: sodium:solute symporter [Bacteroidota bacterium]